MENKYETSKKILEKNGQEHLLAFYEELSSDKKEEILNEILKIDFEELNLLYDKIKNPVENEEAIIEPIFYVDKENLNKEKLKYYNNIGRKKIEGR